MAKCCMIFSRNQGACLRRSRSVAFVLWFVLLLKPAFVVGQAEKKFDLLLRNGTVVDGTGNPWFRGDVAVSGDRIVQIGHVQGEAARELDASSLVVAPGFIDIHSHSDWLLLEDGN